MVNLRRLAVAAAALSMLIPATPTAARAAAAPPAQSEDGKVRGELEERLRRSPGESQNAIVVLQPGSSEGDVRRSQRDVGVGGRPFRIIPAFAARLSPGQIRRLARDPQVRQIELNGRVRIAMESARSSFGVDAAYAAGYTGSDGSAPYGPSDSVVAVLDTGIDDSNPELAGGKVTAFVECTPTQAGGSVCAPAPPRDDHGHGTHVAGIVAATGSGALRGVAPGAALVGVKVLDAGGGGSDSNVIAGIEWAVANKDTYGIDVLTMSLGGPCGPCDGTDAMSAAVDSAKASGLVVTVAAGNDGPSLRTVDAPGVAAGAITVGAMADLAPGGSEAPGFRQAGFSSRGPTADGRHKPDISAPGVAIESTCSHGAPAPDGCANPDTNSIVLSGTSMATPFVAGTAALLLAADPTLTPDEVKAALTGTAVPWGTDADSGTPGHQNDDYGAGRLDVAAAVASVANPDPTPPAVPAHKVVTGGLVTVNSEACFAVTSSASFPLAATMTMSSSTSTNDLDLYLRDSAGNTLTVGDSTERQDSAGTAAGLTAYRVVVRVFAGSSSFELDISNAETVAPCATVGLALTGFEVTDNAANPAAAESGFTNGDVRFTFSATPSGQATQWVVTSTPDPPGATDPGWRLINSLTSAVTGSGEAVFYPWVRTGAGEMSTSGQATSLARTITVDSTPPTISGASVADADGYLRGRETASVSWSAAADANLKAQPITVSAASGGGTLAGPLANSATSTSFVVPSVETASFRAKVTATDKAGNQTSSMSAPLYAMAPGGYWVDGWGGVHRVGAVPTISEARRFGFDIARGLAVRPGTQGGYVLDGFGGIHRFSVGSGPLPVSLTGGPYWSGWDIARDLALRPNGPGGYVLDGFGGIHAVGGAPAVAGAPYFGFDIAEQILIRPDGQGGYVLDGFGGFHPFRIGGSPMPPAVTTAPYYGFDIARGATLLPDGRTGYVLDGYGAAQPIAFGVSAPPRVASGPYWPGWDITRGIISIGDGSGGSILDGYGGGHIWTVIGKPAPPAMPVTGYLGGDGARSVTTR